MRRLFHYLAIHRWGDADDLIEYPDPTGRSGGVQIAIWNPDAACDVTTFATLGMSERIIPHADYRAELTLGIRASLEESTQRELATFLANVSEYAFSNNLTINAWDRISNPGPIPGFPGFPQLLILPVLPEGAFEVFPDPDCDVRMLSVQPITGREAAILASDGSNGFLGYLETEGVDLFSALRSSPAA